MTSERQIRANRNNSRHSTGPKTSQGKTAVRYNALKHGLLAQQVVLPDEDADEYAAREYRLFEGLQPIGPVEELLVEKISTIDWRLRRLRRVEKDIFMRGIDAPIPDDPVDAHRTALEEMARQNKQMDDYEAGRSTTPAEPAPSKKKSTGLGKAFLWDAAGSDGLTKVSRYETQLERAFYTALRTLDELQAARARRTEGPVPAGELVRLALPKSDVDLST